MDNKKKISKKFPEPVKSGYMVSINKKDLSKQISFIGKREVIKHAIDFMEIVIKKAVKSIN